MQQQTVGTKISKKKIKIAFLYSTKWQVFPISFLQGKHCTWLVICLVNLTFAAVITPSRQLNDDDI